MAIIPVKPAISSLITGPAKPRVSLIEQALSAGALAAQAPSGVSVGSAASAGLQYNPGNPILQPKPLVSMSPDPNASRTTGLAQSLMNPGGAVKTPLSSTADPLEAIKQGITAKESGGDYKAQSHSSTASGRYQYLDGTWGGYKGYKKASDAPPEVQDEKFNADMSKLLKRYNNNFEAASIAWFQGPGVADKYIKGDTSVLSKTDANGKTTASYAKEAADIARSYLNGSGPSPVGSTKHLELAITQFGTKEGPGNANPYSREMANSSGQAWCQDFVNWNLKHSGITLPKGANTSGTLNSFDAWKKAGKTIDPTQIQPGDMIYKTRENGGHVAFVVSYDPKTGTVKTISGNSGKGSSEVSYSTSNISSWNIGAVRPS